MRRTGSGRLVDNLGPGRLIFAALVLLLATDALVFAQDANLSRSVPPASAVPKVSPPGQGPDLVPSNFGTADGIDVWIPAYQFMPLSNGSGLIEYIGNHYYAASTTGDRYFAYLPLINGALISGYRPFFRDNDPSNDFSMGIEKVFDDVTATPAPTFTFLAPFTGTGINDANYHSSFVSFPHTIDLREPSGGSVTANTAADFYTLYIDMPSNTLIRFKGVRFFWFRQVSPAPGTATFADVPVGNPQHRFVEALARAGITAGCGSGNYCPNSAVTRGQMAVFLSVALGLHWPPF
jgi:S-layer family protein